MRKEQVSIAFRPDQIKRLRQIAKRDDVSVAHLMRREAERLIKRESRNG